MKRRVLFSYQLLTGLSDTSTGVLLIVAPELTLRLMGLHVAADALPFLSFVGAFVLSVGLCCLYGGYLAYCSSCNEKLGTVWLLTAIMRSSVAIFVITQILSGSLESGWLTVAVFDAACALVQVIGLRRGWLRNAAR
ncbi:MAG: hypothetical protein P4K86_12810 [Terracidiphilus sp.]|nr:hypothetical protein [Terracidiphilus sp.]MDR3775867.1 hypothetical protein [Terracidiphilus sp.]